jgi:cyclic pyranopterin phosphate synthase
VPRTQKRFAPAERLVGEMERARAAGHDRLVLLGGEPLRHPAIVDLVARARALGFAGVGLATNGMRLADERFARDLLRAGVTRIGFSFHSPRAALEDALVGVRGAFARKVSGISNVVRLAGGGLPDGLAANPLLMRPNLRLLREHVRLLAALGLRDVRFNLIRPEGRAAGNRALVPSPEAAVRAAFRLWEARAAGKLGGVDLAFGGFPPCLWPREALRDAEGAGRLFGEARDYDTEVTVVDPATGRADRFRWAERQREALRTVLPACGSCAVRARCGGPWSGYVALYGGAAYAPLEWDPWSA